MSRYHTPGPWRKNGKQSVRGPNGEYIANTNWNNGIANATLISTAPELLEVVKRFVRFNEEDDTADDTQNMIEYGQMLEAAKAAIAKAEREE